MKFRVKQGKTFGANDQYGEGAIVELSQQDGATFPDKLEPVELEIEPSEFAEEAEKVDDVPVIRKSRKKKESE